MIYLIHRAVEWYRMNIHPADAFAGFIIILGAFIFSRWLFSTSAGRTALSDAKPRRNSMPLYVPLLAIAFYVLLRSAAQLVIENTLPDSYEWQKVFLDTLFGCICALLVIAGIIATANVTFARRLKGFGLRPGTIGKDFAAAVVNLVGIWPILTIAVLLTILVSHFLGVKGPAIEKHKTLEEFVLYRQLPVQITMIIYMVIITPVFEELIFRGLLQTLVRRYVPGVWTSIFLGSIIFATSHANHTHWPALFVLSLCLGYSYEKSGSLFRPIFIHALFNAANVLSAVLTTGS